jgi:hypothetical protein
LQLFKPEHVNALSDRQNAREAALKAFVRRFPFSHSRQNVLLSDQPADLPAESNQKFILGEGKLSRTHVKLTVSAATPTGDVSRRGKDTGKVLPVHTKKTYETLGLTTPHVLNLGTQ